MCATAALIINQFTALMTVLHGANRVYNGFNIFSVCAILGLWLVIFITSIWFERPVINMADYDLGDPASKSKGACVHF